MNEQEEPKTTVEQPVAEPRRKKIRPWGLDNLQMDDWVTGNGIEEMDWQLPNMPEERSR